MKKIIIRNFIVYVLLGVISASLVLTIFVSLWFALLIFVSFFLLDAFDSMLEWRLKRATTTTIKPLIWVYLVVLVACMVAFYSEAQYLEETPSIKEHPCALGLIIYLGSLTIFTFRYLLMLAKICRKECIVNDTSDWIQTLVFLFKDICSKWQNVDIQWYFFILYNVFSF